MYFLYVVTRFVKPWLIKHEKSYPPSCLKKEDLVKQKTCHLLNSKAEHNSVSCICRAGQLMVLHCAVLDHIYNTFHIPQISETILPKNSIGKGERKE